MVEFALPTVYSHPDGWGPPDGDDVDGLGPDVFNFAFEHLDKYPLPRAARICDFTVAGLKYQADRLAKGKGAKGKGKGQTLTPSRPDDEGFALVDNRPLPNKTFSRGRGFGFGRGKGRGKGIQANYQEGILGQNKKPTPQNQNQKGKGKGRGGVQQRRGIPSFKEWSVNIKTDWPLKREIPLGNLGKLQLDAKEVKVEDVLWCGDMPSYDKSFDRLAVHQNKGLRRFEDLSFYNVSTSDDPNFEELMTNDPEIQVFATDHVLACLIAAVRSVYSWDLVITKIDGKLIIDKRDFSQVDFLSVNETAQEPPNNDDKDNMNSAVKLSNEATCINQNFSQNMLDTEIAPEEMESPNPFEIEGEARPASGAYRWRKFTIPGNIKEKDEFAQQPLHVLVRTDVNCKMPGGDNEKPQYVSIKALNEFDPKPNYNWRKHLDTQRGMIMATELKNNAFKLGRWTAQAILAGCDVMKLGYVSRVDPKDRWSHAVLSVQTHITDKFAEQIGMHRNNVWGIIRSIVNMTMEWDDGKYLLIKDPLKPYVRLFEIPWDTFQNDDEEEGDVEESDDGGDIDEDGNVAPSQPVGPTG
jgi:translation initiation factor 3 subunit D